MVIIITIQLVGELVLFSIFGTSPPALLFISLIREYKNVRRILVHVVLSYTRLGWVWGQWASCGSVRVHSAFFYDDDDDDDLEYA